MPSSVLPLENPVIKRGEGAGIPLTIVTEPVMKRGGAGIPLTIVTTSDKEGEGRGWDPINYCNPATFFCLSQAMTWISNVICMGFFFYSMI